MLSELKRRAHALRGPPRGSRRTCLHIRVVDHLHGVASEGVEFELVGSRLGLGDGRVGDNHGLCVLALRKRLQMHDADPAGTNDADTQDAVVGKLHVHIVHMPEPP